MFCKVGMLPLSILADGIMLHATVTKVLQECKMLTFVRFFHPNATSYNVSCHLESMLSLYVIFRLLYWHFSNCILTVILEMQIYPVNWFHSLVSLQICNLCESYFYNESYLLCSLLIAFPPIIAEAINCKVSISVFLFLIDMW